MVSDGRGGAIVVWDDFRNGDADQYVQQVALNGWMGNYSTGPHGLVSVPVNGAVVLAWNVLKDSYFSRYRIYCDTIPHPTKLIDSTMGGGLDTLKVVGGLTNGVKYYAVRRKAPFSDVFATPNLSRGDRIERRRWNAQSVIRWKKTNGPYFLRYRIYSDTISNPSTIVDSSTNGDRLDTSRTIGGLTNGKRYYFRVKALNVYGMESESSNEASCAPNVIMGTDFKAGWNMVSIPVKSLDNRTSKMFPTATSHAFAFTNGAYRMRDTLDNGPGFWLKFSTDLPREFDGSWLMQTHSGQVGWNMIGAVSHPIATTDIMSIPPELSLHFYTYESNYVMDDTVRPGAYHPDGDGAPILAPCCRGRQENATILIAETSSEPRHLRPTFQRRESFPTS
jgi:hypothetical protein